MIRLIISILFILGSVQIQAQGFELYYNIGEFGNTNEVRSLEQFNGSIYAIEWYPELAITKFDEDSGEMQDQLLTDIFMYVGWRAGTSMDEEGNIYIAGAGYIENLPKLIKVNPNLNIEYEIDLAVINDSLWHVAHACKVFDNKLYILLEAYYLEDSDTSEGSGDLIYPGFVVTDLEGQLLDGPFWVDTDNTDDLMWHIDVTEDGVYLGGSNEPVVFDGNDTDPYVMKLSHQGELEWAVEIEDDQWDMSFDNFQAALKVHEDGSIYVGSFVNPEYPIQERGWPSITKISPDGEVLWTQFDQENPTCTYCRYNEIILEEDAIYAAGCSAISGIQQQGALTKLSYEGETIWTRTFAYELPSEEYYPVYQFMDLKRLDDGGFVLGGTDLFGADRNSWIVRTDEFGCIIPGCSIGLNDEPSYSEMTIYPNPASNQINIDLSRNITGVLTAELIDLRGRLVLRTNLVSNSNAPTYQIEVDDVPTGYYLLTLRADSGFYSTSPVVIE
ncbi:T9SS type A sorting domain-containing protein [Sanyastnella coralliicola]|uniref:T9SS type A sorting domain-containing protein n=1 Tax=Sanyastnella coralliicola TaxID=3069118 RepID=UPI0027BA7D74|nr:T9SS type A sorting domain-containing protein [Longitalea sp. SCSIO 12813]